MILTSAVPLVWMYLFVVAFSRCLPRPSAKTVIGFIVDSSVGEHTWNVYTCLLRPNAICIIAYHPVV